MERDTDRDMPRGERARPVLATPYHRVPGRTVMLCPGERRQYP